MTSQLLPMWKGVQLTAWHEYRVFTISPQARNLRMLLAPIIVLAFCLAVWILVEVVSSRACPNHSLSWNGLHWALDLERSPKLVPIWHTQAMKRSHASNDIRARAGRH